MNTVVKDEDVLQLLKSILKGDDSLEKLKENMSLINKLIFILENTDGVPDYFTASGLEKGIFITSFNSVLER